MYRLLYFCYRLFSAARHGMRRRFTRTGLALFPAWIVAATLGFDTDNAVAYQAFTVLFSILVVSLVFLPVFRGKFSITRSLPRFGTAGQPFSYRVAVTNLTAKPQTGLSLLENLADPRPCYAEWKAWQLDEEKRVRPFRYSDRQAFNPFRFAVAGEAVLPTIPPGQSAEAEIELTPLRRGLVRFEGAMLARPDPLGVYRSFVKVRAPQSVLILPKRYALPAIAMPGALKYQQGGVALASNVGQSDEFVALRDYRHGDPLRHIHWRSWARMGRPIVREFEDDFFVRHALVLDTFTGQPHSAEFEEAVSVAASFASTMLTQESLLDLLFVGPEAYCFTAGRGLAHADQMLEILASVSPISKQPFSSLEELVINHAPLVSGCIIVLLDWDAPRRQLVEKLKSLGLPVLVFVIRANEDTAPLDPGPMRDAPERLHALRTGIIQSQLATLQC